MADPSDRWHSPTCDDPRIVLEDHEPRCELSHDCPLLPYCSLMPYCQNCRAWPPLHDIIRKYQDAGTFASAPVLPPDEPYGHMNLSWPSLSLYENTEVAKPLSQDLAAQEREPPSSVIYSSTLKLTQFRQICLSAAESEQHPVHVNLEVYDDDNYPEYEAFSYCWAGENPQDRNGTLACRPVYVGRWWDTLSVTENCWELLRFARTSQGTRNLWVDAICINQSSMREKEHQVAKMGKIFKKSSRVIIYLGPEAVIKPHDRFPRRRRLEELANGTIVPRLPDGSTIDLRRLLDRRYFKRLWVIQELILAPSVVVRVGDIDFLVDPVTLSQLENLRQWEWNNTGAPWMQDLAQQNFRGKDSCDALELVSNSQCSDPRDRLFGVSGLMGTNDTAQDYLMADYSLSEQHMWIGFFAHCLLKLDIFWFLVHAVGHQASPNEPSWIPNWRSPKMWQDFKRRGFPRIVTRDYRDLWIEDSDRPGPFRSFYYLPGRFPSSGPTLEWVDPAWNAMAAVDAKIGSLNNVRAVHLFSIPSLPIPLARTEKSEQIHVMLDLQSLHRPRLRGFKTFKDRKMSKLYLISEQRLHEIIVPQQDHLFMLYTKPKPIFLILRELRGSMSPINIGRGLYPEENRGSKYWLISVLSVVSLDMGDPVLEQRIEDLDRLRSVQKSASDIRERIVGKMRKLSIISMLHSSRLHWKRDADPEDYFDYSFWQGYGRVEEKVEWGNALATVLLGYTEKWQLFSLYWSLAREIAALPDEVPGRRFHDSYLACISQTFHPTIQGGYLEFCVNANQWNDLKAAFEEESGIDYERRRLKFSPVLEGWVQIWWEWRFKWSEWSQLGDGIPSECTANDIKLRTPLNVLMSHVKFFLEYDDLPTELFLLWSSLGMPDLDAYRNLLLDPGTKLPRAKAETDHLAIDGDVWEIDIV